MLYLPGVVAGQSGAGSGQVLRPAIPDGYTVGACETNEMGHEDARADCCGVAINFGDFARSNGTRWRF